MSLLPVFLRRVDLFTLRLFLAAIDEGRIGRAAEREHIVPSAATRRIQDLEELAGLQLFERNPRGVAPSAAGRVVVGIHRKGRYYFAPAPAARLRQASA